VFIGVNQRDPFISGMVGDPMARFSQFESFDSAPAALRSGFRQEAPAF
jgi:hypothetical protein